MTIKIWKLRLEFGRHKDLFIAKGKQLDKIGEFYDIKRLKSKSGLIKESDRNYRIRLLDEVTKTK